MQRSTDISTLSDEQGRMVVEKGDLILVVGNGLFLTHRVETLDMVIGRDPACGLSVDHPSLSRRHARLRLGDEVTVQDLDSTNGTWVSGQRIRGGTPVVVPDQTGFQIGPYSFVIVSRRHESSMSASDRQQLRVIDPSIDGLPSLVHEFARTDANILVNGQTGVGKEILATSLHQLSGRSGPLVQLNCAALSENLLENELFGHERGAFTGAVARSTGLIEAAAGGTLLLDEIGEMPLSTQAKLLRVIERREVLRLGSSRAIPVDVRFIAATNRDLIAEVGRKNFREDLYFRLDGITLFIPPLRERRGMIAPLAMHFLTSLRNGERSELSTEVVAALEEHPWPGNVRELKAVIGRAAVLARGGPVTKRHLMLGRNAAIAETADTTPALGPETSADRARIVQALEECAGNQTRAAKLLGISRTTMITKLRIYKIPRPSARR